VITNITDDVRLGHCDSATPAPTHRCWSMTHGGGETTIIS